MAAPTAGVLVHDLREALPFAGLPEGLAQADIFATGVGLMFVSEDVDVTRRRGLCTSGFSRCRTHAGAFTAMWKVPQLQSRGYGGGPDAIALPRPLRLVIEDSCPWTPAGVVEMPEGSGHQRRIARFLELGP